MTEWSLIEREWPAAPPPLPMPYDPYQYAECDPCYTEKKPPQHLKPMSQFLPPQAHPFSSPPSPLTLLLASSQHLQPTSIPMPYHLPASEPYLPTLPKVETPRELRNKAEKQRRDKLNKSISELAELVPPVVYSDRKVDKTGVLRYTAHYLRSHQYVFDTQNYTAAPEFNESSTRALLHLLNGFLLTTTYRGLIVVVSENIMEYLGYTELELLGRSVFNFIHEDDRQLFREQLMPQVHMLGHKGELLIPDEVGGREKVAEALARERRSFLVRFIKIGSRSEPCQYVTCHVEGSFRMSDGAGQGNRCCQRVRRVRARSENPYSSGNDVVFVGIVRPSTETFINESALESYRMEYKTRHSIDGEIIQCEHRISIVTGYMTTEVSGINAMNFIHRDEVHWVVIALKEMYITHQQYGESCYRLITKNGQFVYMRTRGKLEIEVGARAVTSFVCTNTLVDEEEGKHHIKLMKDRFSGLFNKYPHPTEDVADIGDSEDVPLESPKQLEKVILNLVTDLPQPNDNVRHYNSNRRGGSPVRRLALIPPNKERIVSAIEKINTVFECKPKQLNVPQDLLVKGAAQIQQTPSTPHFQHLTTFNNVQFQSQRSFETEFYSDTYNSTTPTDFMTVNNSCDETSSLNCSNTEMQFQMVSPLEVDVEPVAYERKLSTDSMLPDLSTAGIKRSKKYDDTEITLKKKVLGSSNDKTAAEQSIVNRCDASTLGMFFDESFLNSQIQLEFNALEDTINPNFPDLLISEELEDILGTIQGDEDKCSS